MNRHLGCLLLLSASVAWADSGKIEYNRDVRSILADACFRCHGFDQNKRKAGRRLDTREGAMADNDGVRALIPGRWNESEISRRIHATDPDTVMPPPDEARQLTPAEKLTLQRWVEQGGEYQAHWAYLPPVRPALPEARRDGTTVDAIDHFILLRLQQEGIAPSPLADRATLTRRLWLDLAGLPPTPEEVDQVVRDPSPQALDALADRLLASNHFAERMAVWWLDQVRYADSNGYHSDNPVNVSPYRDWVIRAFFRNKPFDRFTIEQVAGDLVPDATLDTRIASTYNRLNLTTEEGGAQPKQYEAKYLTDRVKSIGTTWLAQTFMCAECHDHKFDPVTTRDFYSLGAFFADIDEPAVGPRGPGALVADAAQLAKLKEFDDRLEPLRSRDAKDPERLAAQKARDDIEKSLPHCLITKTLSAPRTVRILPRGDWQNESGEVVLPATPRFLPGFIESAGPDQRLTRLDLARWLVSRENPLTARVFVNRLWKLFFGAGLSRTLEDIGTQSEVPLHQPLLDWLACEFMESGWDVKHIVRLMVTSSTYRRASTATPAMIARDPQNREFARGSRWRLDAEFVRDNALTLGGLIVHRTGGPSVKPYQPAGYWENLNFPPREWEPSRDDNQWRRGLYTWWQRSYLHPALLAFDAPTREECAPDRARSIIPQQALVLLNETSFIEAARGFAARILAEGGKEDDARIAWAWNQATSRPPDKREVELLRGLLEKHRRSFSDNPKAAADLAAVGLKPPPKDVAPVELAAWTSVTRALLNLHETITRQ